MGYEGQFNLLQMSQLAQGVGELGTAETLADLRRCVFERLGEFAPGSVIVHDEIDFSTKAYSIVLAQKQVLSDSTISRFWELLQQGHHPYEQYIRQGGSDLAMRTTDLVCLKSFARNPIFDEIFRPAAVPFGMFSLLPIAGSSALHDFAVLRDSDFRETEKCLVRVYLEQVGRSLNRLARANELHALRLRVSCGRAGLTRREAEVIHQAFQGRTDREIAQRLGTSPHTVRHQLEKIYRKLRVRSRVAAFRCLLGLADRPD